MKQISMCALATLVISAASYAQKGDINLKPGQKYVVENKLVTTSSTEMQGQTMEANIDATTTYTMEVKGAEGDHYNLINTVTNLKMSMSQMGQEMSFDSDNKEDQDGLIGSALKGHINLPKDVVVNNSGKVIPPPKTDSSETSLIAKQLGDFETSGYGAALAFDALPKKLKVGDTWTDSSSENGITRATNYTVKEINDNMATLALKGTISTDLKMEQNGMEITTKTDGTFTGEEIVNIQSGVVQSNTTNAEATGIIGVMGQELPTTSKVTSTTTVKTL